VERKKRFSIGQNPVLLGLCDGIANYFIINVWIIRLLVFVTFYLVTGSLIMNFLLYVLVAFFMPQAKVKYQVDSEFRSKK
jgi:phage shock protein PspC (stress-responsive transcriptional regulator)